MRRGRNLLRTLLGAIALICLVWGSVAGQESDPDCDNLPIPTDDGTETLLDRVEPGAEHAEKGSCDCQNGKEKSGAQHSNELGGALIGGGPGGCTGCGRGFVDPRGVTGPNANILRLELRRVFKSRSKEYDSIFGSLWNHNYSAYVAVHDNIDFTLAQAIFHTDSGSGISNQHFDNEPRNHPDYTPEFSTAWNPEYGFTLTELDPDSIYVAGHEPAAGLSVRAFRLVDQRGMARYYLDPYPNTWDPDPPEGETGEYNGKAYLYKTQDIYGNVLVFDRVYEQGLVDTPAEEIFVEPSDENVSRLRGIYEYVAGSTTAVRSITFDLEPFDDGVPRAVALTRVDGGQVGYRYIHDTGLGRWINALTIYPDRTYGIYDIGVDANGPFWEFCDNHLDGPQERAYIGKMVEGSWDANGGICWGLSRCFEEGTWTKTLEMTHSPGYPEVDQSNYELTLTGGGKSEAFDEDGYLTTHTDNDTGGEMSLTYGGGVQTHASLPDGREYHYHHDDPANNRYGLVRKDHEYGAATTSEFWEYYYAEVNYGDEIEPGGGNHPEPLTVRLLKSYTDREGNKTSYTYYFKGLPFNENDTYAPEDLRLVSRTYEDASTESWTYYDDSENDGNYYGLVKSYTSPDGRTTQVEYDQYGYVSRVVHPDGLDEEEEHNLGGMLTAKVDKADRRWEYQYNEMDQLTRITYPDGSLEETEYNECSDWDQIPSDPVALKTWIEDKQALDNPVGAATLVHRHSRRYYPAGIQPPFVAETPVWTVYEYDIANRVVSETVVQDTTELAHVWRRYNDTTQQIEEVQTDSTFTFYEYTGRFVRRTARLVSGTPGDPGQEQTRLDSGLWQVSEHTYEYELGTRYPTRRIACTDRYYIRDGVADDLRSRTEFVYTPEGRIDTQTVYSYISSTQTAGDPLSKVSYAYDANGNMVSETVYKDDISSYTTTYQYDEKNRLTKIIHPDSSERRFWYDDDGNKLQERNEEGHDFYWTYDNQGRLSTHTAAVSGNNDVDREWDYSYNTTEKQFITTASNNKNGAVVKEYEGCCARIFKVEQTADGDVQNMLTTLYFYTGPGMVRKTIEPSGKATTRSFDGLDRVTEVRMWKDDESASFRAESYEYAFTPSETGGTAGRKVTRYVPKPGGGDYQWVSVYDGLGRLVQSTDPAGETTSYEYDISADGDDLAPSGIEVLVSRTVDRLGREDRTYRDMAGRTVRKVDDRAGLKAVTDYSYDLRGLLSDLTAHRGTSENPLAEDQTTHYDYDSRGRLVKETLASNSQLSHPKEYLYYPDGALEATIEQRSSDGDIKWVGIRYTRDQLNRVLSRDYFNLASYNNNPDVWGTPDATDSFSYDDASGKTTASGSLYNTWVETKRNDLGQILYEKQKHSDGIERMIDYSYYQAAGKGGELKRVYYPSGGGNRIRWDYDAYHRPLNLSRVVDGASTLVANWSWNDDGSVSRLRRNNSGGSWVFEKHFYYETVGRLSHTRSYVNGQNSFNLRCEYDAEGNRLTQRIDEETYWDERYYYDTLYRLEEMKRGHVYQDQGEWVVSNVQRTEDWALDLLGNWNEYDVTGDETISEDRTHNDLNQITAIDQTSLTYDLQGNLTSDGSKTYEWDIRGRLAKVKEGETTLAEFRYDSYGRRVMKISPLEGKAYDYYYDGWRVIEEYLAGSVTARNVWGLYLDETVVRTSATDGKDYYPCLNPIYSAMRIYDGSGSLIARVQYTPYGKPTLVDSGGDPISVDFPHLFTGQRWHENTCLYDYKYRSYSVPLGRFTSVDLFYAHPALRYSYVANIPTRFLDPYGAKIAGGCEECDEYGECGSECDEERCRSEASVLENAAADFVADYLSSGSSGMTGNLRSWGSGRSEGCVGLANCAYASIESRIQRESQEFEYEIGPDNAPVVVGRGKIPGGLKCWTVFRARLPVYGGLWGHSFVVFLNLCSGGEYRFDPWLAESSAAVGSYLMTKEEHPAGDITGIYYDDATRVKQEIRDWIMGSMDSVWHRLYEMTGSSSGARQEYYEQGFWEVEQALWDIVDTPSWQPLF